MTTNDSNMPGGEDFEESSPIEREFLSGYEDGEPDEFDEELRSLVETRERGSVLRPILMIALILIIGWVIYDWKDELAYFVGPWEPVEIGDVADFSVNAAEDPDWEPPLEHNAYVSMEGMPTRVSSGGDYEFFRLLGAEVYVQRSVDDLEDDEALADEERSLPRRNMGPGLPVDEHRTLYRGEGRLISFASDPERVAGLKEFYGEHYNLRFCEDYTDHHIEELEEQQLEVIRENWQQRYEEADEERRVERELTPEPTSGQEQQLLQQNPVCVDAYMLQDDHRPVDSWWYVLFSVLLAALAVFNGVRLVRWFRGWLKP